MRPDAAPAVRTVPRFGDFQRVGAVARLNPVRRKPTAEYMHEALVRTAYDGAMVEPYRGIPALPKTGRQQVATEPTRQERQLEGGIYAEEVSAELPKACDTGTNQERERR